jgi:DNA-binding NarL/FixJ family response regulator
MALVYLVEDSPLIRERVRMMIAEIDPKIEVAEGRSSCEAIEGMRNRQPEVVVLDMELADGSSGLEVLKDIKMRFSDTKVIVLTSHSNHHYRKRCMDEGADYFFDKAHGFKEAMSTLKSMMLEAQ